MPIKKFKGLTKELKIYFIIIACVALALGFSNNIYSNFFKDAYNVTAFQRGFIEFPRELPGVFCTVLIALLGFLRDTRIAIMAQALSIIGVIFLGITSPIFSVMLIFLFINSMGMHLFFPVEESIGLFLAEGHQVGKRMGQYKGVFTGFTMIASGAVFFAFKYNIFSFTSNIKWIFIISGIFSGIALILFVYLDGHIKNPIVSNRKINFVFRKEYKYYYIVAIMRGVQKQIMFVYGPWVLIDILSKKADTIAMLTGIGSLLGVFFIPAVGRWLDQFGVKKMMYVDAISFIVVYLFYGILSAGFASGKLMMVGFPVILAYGLLIIDRMSMQMGIVRTLYLKKIAIKDSDIMPTISFAVSLDHVVSIIVAGIGGLIWAMYGPQYIFFITAALSLINLYVAIKVEDV